MTPALAAEAVPKAEKENLRLAPEEGELKTMSLVQVPPGRVVSNDDGGHQINA